MNILLVDDDVYVIEALKNGLDFKAVGIENAYFAYGVEQAKKIIEDVPIHILVSDIEMPKENGFDLLEWIREKGYVMQEILLTMYAEFHYAKQAIRYNCFAYALKPIDYQELTELIKGAVEKEKKELKNLDNEHYYELWTLTERKRKEYFFKDLIRDRLDVGREAYRLDYSMEDKFVPVMVRHFEELHSYGMHVIGMVDWTIKNLIRECFHSSEVSCEVIWKSDDGLYFLIVRILDKVLPEKNLENSARSYLDKLQKKMKIEGAVVIGKDEQLDELQEQAYQFECWVRETVLELGQVCIVQDYTIPKKEYLVADYRMWEKLLNEKQAGLVKICIEEYLEEEVKQGRMNRSNLNRISDDFLQMIFIILKENGILTYEMEEPVFSVELVSRSKESVVGAKQAMCHMVDTVIKLISGENGERSILDKVLDYIDGHLDEELSRDMLAKMVYLNPDYLARIFKKKMGESIGNYIMNQRVEMAKTYLAKTDEPIRMIAAKSGYDNFSYFTKVFKSRATMTPREYRKLYSANVEGENTNEIEKDSCN